uniref:Zinc finger protein 513 n=1 Tax=Cacopsylla melanoneura TaxID=428564 RepID=A0A8D9AT33_9HEMI
MRRLLVLISNSIQFNKSLSLLLHLLSEINYLYGFHLTLFPEFSVFDVCQNCGLSLPKNVSSLLEHGRLCSSVLRPDKSYSYVCYACPYHTQLCSNMRRHIHVHCDVKFLKCPHCSYESGNYTHMKRHSLKHSKEKPYKCSFCEFRTSRNDVLKIHLVRKHIIF